MLMHKWIAKQRLMRLIKYKKVLVREDFWHLSQRVSHARRLSFSSGKKNLPYAEAPGMLHHIVTP